MKTRVQTTASKLNGIVPSGALSLVVAVLLALLCLQVLWAQEVTRKAISKTAPSYPELAKKMHASGKVKVEAVIAPGGSVTSAKVVGGSPVFEKCAVDAVKLWKFESAPRETKAIIVLDFTDQ